MRYRTRIAFSLLSMHLVAALVAAAWRAEGPALASIAQVAIAPAHPETVYAATAGGGIWRSDDGGQSWTLPGDGMTGRKVVWIAVDPADAASVWAGVEGGNSAVWRSSDSGATWKPLSGSTATGRMQPVGQPVAFAPTQPKTIFLPSTNLHYRSDDGGKTWRDFRVPNQDAYAFAVSPKDPKTVWAGGRGASLNISRSADGGKTWKQIGVGLGKNSVKVLLVDPAQPTTLYAAAGTFANIFKSTDAGESWGGLALPVGGTSDLFDLAIDPVTGRTLWAATEDGLYRSTDGGASWQNADRGMGRYLAKTVAFDPSDPRHLIAGTGTGIYQSQDGGDSWSPSSNGFSGGWVKKVWSAPGANVLFAQLSVGLYRYDGPGAWSELTAPFESGKSADIDGILFDAGSAQSLYAFDTSKYWRSSDGGRRWQEVEQKGPSMRDMMKGNTESAQFASLAQDRGNAKTLYAGSWSNDGAGGAVYKTTDGGKKWAPSGQGVPNGKVGLLRAGAPGTVYAVVDEKAVYRTTNGGGSWSAASGLPDAKIHDLAVDGQTPTRLYAATEKGLYRSTDAGATFARIANGLGDDEIDAVAIDPASGAVFAGAFHGVFRSAAGGDNFAAMSDGLTHRDVRALAIGGSPARLWAGTAGGGVYSTEIP